MVYIPLFSKRGHSGDLEPRAGGGGGGSGGGGGGGGGGGRGGGSSSSGSGRGGSSGSSGGSGAGGSGAGGGGGGGGGGKGGSSGSGGGGSSSGGEGGSSSSSGSSGGGKGGSSSSSGSGGSSNSGGMAGSSGSSGSSSSGGTGASSGSSGSNGGLGGTPGSSGSRSSSISAGGTTVSASTYNRGGGSVSTIPRGSLFAGRQQGGGSRDQIYGTRQYGSGYPGVVGRGVAGRNFPFYFWPLTFGGVGAAGAYHYLDGDGEYGHPDNSSRPGGPQTAGNFTSSSGNSTFRLVADNYTTTSLLEGVNAQCSSNLDISKTSQDASTFVYNVSWAPSAGEVVQYYRASSVALMLVGYNNSAVWDDESKADDPLPSWVDQSLLTCLNTTIGATTPLIDGNGSVQVSAPSMGLIGAIVVVWFMSVF